jgi:hypothetical protein
LPRAGAVDDLTEARRANADLTPEMVEMLRTAAEHQLGTVCRPGQVQKLWPLLSEAARLKLVVFLDVEHPMITDMGRRAIGAPSQAQASHDRLVELCRRNKSPPRRDADPRTDFDYRSYKSMGYVCTLVVRQPDARHKPATVRVGRTLGSDPQFLGPRNSIVLPECEGTPFVLAVIPKWLLNVALFSTCPFALDEDDASWSDDDRATWDRLRSLCMSVNTRIRRGSSQPTTTRRAYGETA